MTAFYPLIRHGGVCKNVTVYSGISQEDLQRLLEHVFDVSGKILGLEEENGPIMTLSTICQHPQCLQAKQYSLVIKSSRSRAGADDEPNPVWSKRDESDYSNARQAEQVLHAGDEMIEDKGQESPTSSRENQLYMFVDRLFRKDLITSDERAMLHSLIRESDPIVLTAFEVCQIDRNVEDLKDVLVRVARMNICREPRLARQDKLLQAVALLVRTHQIDQREASVLKNLILAENPLVRAAFESFELNEDGDELKDTLIKIVQRGTPGLDRPSSPTPQYKDTLVRLVVSLAQKKLDTDELRILRQLLQENNEFLMSAFDVFEADQDQDELLDTVVRLVKKSKRDSVALQSSASASRQPDYARRQASQSHHNDSSKAKSSAEARGGGHMSPRHNRPVVLLHELERAGAVSDEENSILHYVLAQADMITSAVEVFILDKDPATVVDTIHKICQIRRSAAPAYSSGMRSLESLRERIARICESEDGLNDILPSLSQAGSLIRRVLQAADIIAAALEVFEVDGNALDLVTTLKRVAARMNEVLAHHNGEPTAASIQPKERQQASAHEADNRPATAAGGRRQPVSDEMRDAADSESDDLMPPRPASRVGQRNESVDKPESVSSTYSAIFSLFKRLYTKDLLSPYEVQQATELIREGLGHIESAIDLFLSDASDEAVADEIKRVVSRREANSVPRPDEPVPFGRPTQRSVSPGGAADHIPSNISKDASQKLRIVQQMRTRKRISNEEYIIIKKMILSESKLVQVAFAAYSKDHDVHELLNTLRVICKRHFNSTLLSVFSAREVHEFKRMRDAGDEWVASAFAAFRVDANLEELVDTLGLILARKRVKRSRTDSEEADPSLSFPTMKESTVRWQNYLSRSQLEEIYRLLKSGDTDVQAAFEAFSCDQNATELGDTLFLILNKHRTARRSDTRDRQLRQRTSSVDEPKPITFDSALQRFERNNLLMPEQTRRIASLAAQKDLRVVAAWAVYQQDGGDLEELLDTLRRVDWLVYSQSQSVSAASDALNNVLEPGRQTTLRMQFQSIDKIRSLSLLSDEQASVLKDLAKRAAASLTAAFELYARERDVADFVDTLRRIANAGRVGKAAVVPTPAGPATTGFKTFTHVVDDLTDSGRLSVEDRERLFALASQKDPRIVGAWAVYQTTKDADDLCDTLQRIHQIEFNDSDLDDNAQDSPPVIVVPDSTLGRSITDSQITSLLHALHGANKLSSADLELLERLHSAQDAALIAACELYQQTKWIDELLDTLQRIAALHKPSGDRERKLFSAISPPNADHSDKHVRLSISAEELVKQHPRLHSPVGGLPPDETWTKPSKKRHATPYRPRLDDEDNFSTSGVKVGFNPLSPHVHFKDIDDDARRSNSLGQNHIKRAAK
eukprot:GILJ01005352.1.p1 GENE.GILJ01005352.1~~GILJ01005352.1.p1  ORF type:complete len:1382 (-),score=208.70 GILJ01005352.1:217-4362(-)